MPGHYQKRINNKLLAIFVLGERVVFLLYELDGKSPQRRYADLLMRAISIRVRTQDLDEVNKCIARRL